MKLISIIQLDPQRDPDVAQAIVEFMNRLLSKYVEVLVNYEPKTRIELLFLFALDSVAVREPLVKKAACSFWVSLVWHASRDGPPRSNHCIIGNTCWPSG